MSVADKVKSYETFLNETLKADLAKASQVKARLRAELHELEDLEANLGLLQKASMALST